MAKNIHLPKRILCFSFIFLSSMAFISSCKKDDTVILRVRYFGAGTYPQMVRRITSQWLKEHPNVKIQLEYAPWNGYVTKILTENAGGKTPDIGWIENSMAPQLIPKNVFRSLNSFLSNDTSFDISGYWPTIVKTFRYQEELYCIPSDIAPTACLFYNKTLFQQAGLSYPKDDWDWDQFLDTAKRLTKRDQTGKTIQWGFFTDYYNTFIYSAGGRFVDNLDNPTECTLDSPEAIKGLQFFMDLVLKHKVMPSPSGADSSLNDICVEQKFIFQKVAMIYAGIWVSENLNEGIKDTFDWDMVLPPRCPGKSHVVVPSGGSGWGIFSKSEHPELAWELLKVLVGPDAQRELATKNIQPALIALSTDPKVWGNTTKPANRMILNKVIPHIVFSPRSVKWSKAEQVAINPLFYDLWNKKIDVSTAVRKMKQEADKILSE